MTQEEIEDEQAAEIIENDPPILVHVDEAPVPVPVPKKLALDLDHPVDSRAILHTLRVKKAAGLKEEDDHKAEFANVVHTVKVRKSVGLHSKGEPEVIRQANIKKERTLQEAVSERLQRKDHDIL